MPEIPKDLQAYVGLYLARLRKANKEATLASQKWERRSDFLKKYCAANNYTEFQAREKSNNDWELNDAFSAWSFWEREAKRCADTIRTELACAHMLGGLPVPPQRTVASHV